MSDPGWLIDVFLDHGAPGCGQGVGLPVGNLTSQHFGNFYLGRLDRFAKQTLRVKGYLRYMDDFALLADDKPTLWAWRDAIAAFAGEALGMALKSSATRLMPVAEGVPFLGFRVFPGLIRLGPKQARRWRQAMGGVRRGLDSGALSEDDAARITAGLLGWAAHADTDRFVRSYSARHAPSVGRR